MSLPKLYLATGSGLGDGGSGAIKVVRYSGGGIGLVGDVPLLGAEGLLNLGPMNLAADPGNVQDGWLWYLDSSQSLRRRSNDRTVGLGEHPGSITADSAAVVNTTTETVFNRAVRLPTSWLAPGKSLRICAAGTYSTTGTPNLRISLYLASVVLLAPAVTCENNAANMGWWLDAIVTVRTGGSAGTVMGLGFLALRKTTVPEMDGQPAGNGATSTVDCGRNPCDVEISAKWSAASASNTVKLNALVVQALNW